MKHSIAEEPQGHPTPQALALFRQKAELVSAMVQTASSVDEALTYAVDLCRQRHPGERISIDAEANRQTSPQTVKQGQAAQKIVAAPGLDRDHFAQLATKCRAAGIQPIADGLRNHLDGIELGITWAQYGIAETGSLVVDSSDEQVRLATMISDVHVAMLFQSDVVEQTADIVAYLQSSLHADAKYMAMITGASRTADIERVLALGVHGPLELHILLIEGSHVES